LIRFEVYGGSLFGLIGNGVSWFGAMELIGVELLSLVPSYINFLIFEIPVFFGIRWLYGWKWHTCIIGGVLVGVIDVSFLVIFGENSSILGNFNLIVRVFGGLLMGIVFWIFVRGSVKGQGKT
ncbi:MAG TPA: hypothetical protein VKA55_05965, partial [Gammaproteobacteria bacterium]|nr:hypothetical protein [Gammaproteobacteria bacterium]